MCQRARRKLVVPFLLPPFLVYTIFIIVPVALTVSYAFTSWQGHTLERPFSGLRNYSLILKDPQFANAFRNKGIFAISGAFIVLLPACRIL